MNKFIGLRSFLFPLLAWYVLFFVRSNVPGTRSIDPCPGQRYSSAWRLLGPVDEELKCAIHGAINATVADGCGSNVWEISLAWLFPLSIAIPRRCYAGGESESRPLATHPLTSNQGLLTGTNNNLRNQSLHCHYHPQRSVLAVKRGLIQWDSFEREVFP